MTNVSIFAAFERMWLHIVTKLNGKSDVYHTHDISDVADLQSELDEKVPALRTINGKELYNDIILSASDVGASELNHNHNNEYYTQDQIDVQLSDKVNIDDLTSHTENKSNPHEVTKEQIGLGNVENKSSAAIIGEITASNITTSLGYTPYTPSEVDDRLSEKADKLHSHSISDVANLQSVLDEKALQSDLNTLETIVNNKANKSHTHAISEITDLQSVLDEKVTMTELENYVNETFLGGEW